MMMPDDFDFSMALVFTIVFSIYVIGLVF